jgi:hypothetical protein
MPSIRRSSRFDPACAALSAAALLAMAAPAAAQEPPPLVSPSSWTPGDPIPPGYHVETGPIRGLYITGGAILGAGYVAGLVTGFVKGDSGGGYAAIPVAGPFIAGAVLKTSCQGGFECIGVTLDDAFFKGLLYGFGVVQAAGTVLLVTGVSVHRTRLVRDRTVSLVPVPLAARNGAGLGLQGTF